MARDMQSLAKAIGQLNSDLDQQAGKLFDRMDGIASRGTDAFKKANARLDAHAAALDQVETLVSDLEKSNGGPTLQGSAGSAPAAAPALVEPAASWSGSKTS